MKLFLSVVFICLWTVSLWGQSTFSGSIRNVEGSPLSAIVSLRAKGETTLSGYTKSDTQGKYTVSYIGNADSVDITVSGMFIGKHMKTVSNRSQTVDFTISEKVLQLKEVEVHATKISQSKDTLNYLVGAFANQNDRVIGDVLKKMPGIEVSESGRISFNGKYISKFYVEHMDLLQGRYGLVTNNLSLKAVSVVQVLENHQPIKALRDRLPTGDVAINLKLKEDAKGAWSLLGMLGGGYRPVLWSAELSAMYFGKKQQNIMMYKGNNTGDNVASEFRTHYDYERMYMNPYSMLQVQMPKVPSIPRKRYIENRSHAVSMNHLIKTKNDVEITASALYYDDCIRKEGLSVYEQFLPEGDNLIIEEQLTSLSHIHNAEVVSRVNLNADDYYFNNALNLKANWDDDTAFGSSYYHAGQKTTLLNQHLDKPFFSVDNTMNFIKTHAKNSYKLYFSLGYGQKPHTLTVSPASYLEKGNYLSLAQDVMARDFGAVMRLSYNLNVNKFRMNYSLWGRSDLHRLDTELNGTVDGGGEKTLDDSFRNNLWFNTFQTGLMQNYAYETANFKASLGMPVVYSVFTDRNHVIGKDRTHHRLSVQPSLSLKYEQHNFTFHVSGQARRNFGGLSSSYTGYVMHGYRHLVRNTADRLLENRSVNGVGYLSYKDIFHSFFTNLRFNYEYLWKNLLYGYTYQGILSVKNTISRPTESQHFGTTLSVNKGFNFWSGVWKIAVNYNLGKGEQLIQKEVMKSQSRWYGAGTSFSVSPLSFMSLDYSFSWNESRHYIVGRMSDFPKIRLVSQAASLHVFPTKSITVNLNVEHQYNSVSGQRYTTFADASLKWKSRRIDIELGVNNLFNAKQYVSASYSDVSTSFYSYNLRPLSALLKVRFKIR